MRIIIYNKKKFTHKDVTFRIKGIIITLFVCFSLFAAWSFTSPELKTERIPQETRMLILREEHSFSEAKFIIEIKKYSCKFAHIIMAQAVCESGSFKSRLFKEQNNCFGLRVPKSRLTLNVEEQNNYASFETWKDCVTEYMLYYSSFLRHIKTENEYYKYLGSNYAEDPAYISKIRKVANTYRPTFSAK